MKFYWRPIRSFFKYFGFVFNGLENRKIQKYNHPTEYFPIFIIGLPRSGSTIFYQLLTNYLNISYPSNLVELMQEVPFLGFLTHDLLFDSKPHNTFNSKYGRTERLYAPVEGIFWRKWLIKGKHHILPDELTKKKKEEFQAFINAVLFRFSRSLIIKNLAFGMRLKLIKELFPNARVLYIQRDLFFNAQSIYLAYKKFNIANNKLWSIHPPDYKQIINLPIIEKVVAQMFYLQKEIEKNLPLFSEKYKKIKYEDLITNPLENIKKIKKFLNCKYKQQPDKKLKIYNSNTTKISKQEETAIKTTIKKYYGQQNKI